MMEKNVNGKTNMRPEDDRATYEASLEFSRRLKKYPPEIGIAMGVVLLNLMKGNNWGIASDRNRSFMEAYNKGYFSRGSVRAYKIRRQPGLGSEEKYLVVVDMMKFIDILNTESPLGSMYTKEDLGNALKRRQMSLNQLATFLSKGAEGEIGIFNLNSASEIIINGKRYPSFAVTLTDLITYCVKFGYDFIFPTKDGRGVERISPNVVMNNMKTSLSLMPVAPSCNALIVHIAKHRR